MLMNNKPRYIVISAMSFFVVPIASVVWFVFSYSFTIPDDAPIPSISVVFVFSVFVFIFQLSVYGTLGKSIHKQSSPNIKPGIIYASLLAMPLPIIFFIGSLGMLEPPSTSMAIGIALLFYIYLWVCFISGALVQLWLVKKHNKSINYGAIEANSPKFLNYVYKILGGLSMVVCVVAFFYEYFHPQANFIPGENLSIANLFFHLIFPVVVSYVLIFRTAYIECEKEHIRYRRFNKWIEVSWKDVKSVNKIPFFSSPVYRLAFKNKIKPIYFQMSGPVYFEFSLTSWSGDSSGFLDYARSKISPPP